MNAEHEIRSLFQEAIDSLSTNYEGSSLTDVFVVIDEACGELSIYDDEENNIVKSIITEWENNAGKCIDYTSQLRLVIERMNNESCFSSLDIYTPFSINLSDDDFVVKEELLLIEDESVIHLEDDFLKRMDKEFDEFLEKLLKE